MSASGLALVLRGIFAALNRIIEPRSLYLNPALVRHEYCMPGSEPSACSPETEWFLPGTEPHARILVPARHEVFIRHPNHDLRLVMDSRTDDASEQFRFALSDAGEPFHRVEWIVDDEVAGIGYSSSYFWALKPGRHVVEACWWRQGESEPFITRPVSFEVR